MISAERGMGLQDLGNLPKARGTVAVNENPSGKRRKRGKKIQKKKKKPNPQ